jgi:hypothetical protein
VRAPIIGEGIDIYKRRKFKLSSGTKTIEIEFKDTQDDIDELEVSLERYNAMWAYLPFKLSGYSTLK